MSAIERGAQVIVRTVDNRIEMRRATSGVIEGDDFLVVWVCTEEEWTSAAAMRRDPSAFPWPARDVDMANTNK